MVLNGRAPRKILKNESLDILIIHSLQIGRRNRMDPFGEEEGGYFVDDIGLVLRAPSFFCAAFSTSKCDKSGLKSELVEDLYGCAIF